MTKHAIITGASKGLGKSIAQQLAADGYDVLLIARSENLLRDLAASFNSQRADAAFFLALDLSLADAPLRITEWCTKNNFAPCVLVNNAGFATWGYFEKLSLPLQLEMLQLHVQGTVAVTHAMLPMLRKQPRAYILNVCSTAAYQSVPTLTLYAASKAFIRSFSRGLRYELRKTNISVTCLSPGPMATNFTTEANMGALAKTAQKFEMSPDVVAKAGLRALFKGRSESIPGFTNFFSVYVSKIVPDALLEKIASNIYESKL